MRLVLASSVGSLLWAGCAHPQYSANDIDPGSVSYAPVDQSKRRPDTHPELRTGLYQVAYGGLLPPVVETTVVTAPASEAGTADSTSLLVYNPEVINVALSSETPPGLVANQVQSGQVIVEAAGAEPSGSKVYLVREKRMSWRDRLMQNKRLVEQQTAVPAE
jgi:hypothetical protein